MKKNNNYSQSLVFDPKEQVIKTYIQKNEQETKSTKAVVTSDRKDYIIRRYSFDDNGGGYKGL